MPLSDLDLAQFTGTETWYRHKLIPFVLHTEGIQFVAEHGSAYWLIDKIAALQLAPEIRREEFQLWTLTVHDDHSASLVMTDGNCGDIHLYVEKIDWTDFPLRQLRLYVEQGEANTKVIMLPTEH